MMAQKAKVDFSQGPVWKCIVSQAIPLTIAQLVQLAYNVVDRIYLGHMGDGNSMALTGVGLTFPIITLTLKNRSGWSAPDETGRVDHGCSTFRGLCPPQCRIW